MKVSVKKCWCASWENNQKSNPYVLTARCWRLKANKVLGLDIQDNLEWNKHIRNIHQQSVETSPHHPSASYVEGAFHHRTYYTSTTL